MKNNFTQNTQQLFLFLRVCTLQQIHMTQISRASFLTQRRTRPITEPTYLFLQRKTAENAMAIVKFNLIFQYFPLNMEHWSWYLLPYDCGAERVCKCNSIKTFSKSLLMYRICLRIFYCEPRFYCKSQASFIWVWNRVASSALTFRDFVPRLELLSPFRDF